MQIFSIFLNFSFSIFNKSISDPSILHFKKSILFKLYFMIISSIVMGSISIFPSRDILFLIQSSSKSEKVSHFYKIKLFVQVLHFLVY